jgi:hypothetical protein
MTDKIKDKRYDVSLQTRNFEIELFWKRSAFFWAFITAAFGGYAALRHFDSDLAIVIACFGSVCALAWTLANRGSKYWQETWEARVEQNEGEVTGALFAGEDEPEQTHKGCWLQARRYSVSKLTTALSDYVFSLWISIVAWELLRRYAPETVQPWLKEASLTLYVVASAIFLVLLLVFGRSSRRPHVPTRGS